MICKKKKNATKHLEMMNCEIVFGLQEEEEEVKRYNNGVLGFWNRLFTMELNDLLVMLEAGGCSPEVCPIMKATDTWQYRCAAHKKPEDVV